MRSVTVSISLPTLTRLSGVAKGGLTLNGPLSNVLSQWAVRYRSWAQTRFAKYSAGGGSWPALAPATVKARRNSGDRNIRILRDTNTLYSTLAPAFTGAPGQLQQGIPGGGGIRVGIGGGGQHPDSPATLGQIAAIHHLGLGRVPERTIIVEPPSSVIKAMTSDLKNALDKYTE